VVTSIANKSVEDARHLKLSVANISPGTEVPVKVLRDEKIQELTLKIGEQPRKGALARDDDSAASPNDNNDEGTLNGVGVADLDPQTRQEFDVPAKIRGAIVTEVEPNSAAAAAGLQPGDVIQEINRHPIKGAEDAVKLTEKTETKKTLLRVWSQRGTRFVVVDETEPKTPSQ